MKQLFANNAKAILANPINGTDTSITVDDASLFPNPGAYEYFLITIELAGVIEIAMITARSGNNFTVGGLGRGCENTLASSFSSGARVEVRVTRDSLDRKSTQLYPISSLDLIVAPQDSYHGGYVAGSYDPFGNPALLFTKDLTTWRFFNYTTVASFTSTATTTTSLSASSIVLNALTSGKYIVQITSGIYSGYVRQITSLASNTISWTTALGTAPTVGDTFEILEANLSILQDAITAVALPVTINSGSANAINAVYFPAMTGFTDNQVLGVVMPVSNTSGSVTFAPNALAAKTVVNKLGDALLPGELQGTALLRYDQGTDRWYVINSDSRSITAFTFYVGQL